MCCGGGVDGWSLLTVHVDEPGARSDEALACGREIPEAEGETNAWDDFVAVLFVDGIFDSLAAGFVEVAGLELDQVFDRGLGDCQRVQIQLFSAFRYAGRNPFIFAVFGDLAPLRGANTL
jgi:hypothetical protein